MGITRARRNEIAWLFSLKRMEESSLPTSSVKEICEEISNKFSIKNDAKLYDFVVIFLDTLFSNTLQGVWENKSVKKTNLTVEERNYMAWNILVAEKYHKGIKIGDFVRRDIGNEAKKIGISPQEGRDFALNLITEVYRKTIAYLS